MKRILVTGGSGFIGTNFVQACVDRGYVVLNFDLARPRNGEHHEYWFEGDVRDRQAIDEVLRSFRPTVIVHMAARTDLDGSSLEDYSSNHVGTQVISEACDSLAVPVPVVYFSSRLVLRIGVVPVADDQYDPPNLYGQSKVLGEEFVRQRSRHPWVILRPTSIWGPWFDVPYRDFFETVRRGVFFRVGKTRIAKSFGYVENVCHSTLKVMSSFENLSGSTMYLADYPPIEVGEFADRIRGELGRSPVRSVPLSLLKVGARTGDLLKRLGWSKVPLTSFRLDNLRTSMVYDLDVLHDSVGELPYTAEEGIGRTLAWLGWV